MPELVKKGNYLACLLILHEIVLFLGDPGAASRGKTVQKSERLFFSFITTVYNDKMTGKPNGEANSQSSQLVKKNYRNSKKNPGGNVNVTCLRRANEIRSVQT